MMHKNLNVLTYSAFQSSILNAIFAEGICDTRVSAYDISYSVLFFVCFISEM